MIDNWFAESINSHLLIVFDGQDQKLDKYL